ncbi:MAG: hypothetical protein JWR69_3048 [Pedosphaera sp.]|nr:hypothetical protein [Pedosphaera sp.]
MTTSQRNLPLTVQIRMPLLDVAAVRGALGVDEDDVLLLIEDRVLPWAFNIAVKCGVQKMGEWSERTLRREIRVLSKCVTQYQSIGGYKAAKRIEWPEALRLILPNDKPFLLGTELEQAFICSNELVIDLVKSRQLDLMPGTDYRRGRGGSPVITRASVERFLKARRINE